MGLVLAALFSIPIASFDTPGAIAVQPKPNRIRDCRYNNRLIWLQ